MSLTKLEKLERKTSFMNGALNSILSVEEVLDDAAKKNISFFEVLLSPEVKRISQEVAEAFLMNSISWLSYPELVKKTNLVFLYNEVVKHRAFYTYPYVLELFDDDSITEILTLPDIHYEKLPEDLNLLTDFSLSNATKIINNIFRTPSKASFHLLEHLMNRKLSFQKAFNKYFINWGQELDTLTFINVLELMPESIMNQYINDFDALYEIFENKSSEDLILIMNSKLASRMSLTGLDILLSLLRKELSASFLDKITPIMLVWFKEILVKRSFIETLWIPQSYQNQYISTLFKGIPAEIIDDFFNGDINIHYILNHPSLYKYFKMMDAELLFGYYPVTYNGKSINLISLFTKKLKDHAFGLLLQYLPFLDVLKKNKILIEQPFVLESNEDLTQSIDAYIYQVLCLSDVAIGTFISKSFKKKYPQLYLPQDAPKDLQYAYRNREITYYMLHQHPEWLPFLKTVDLSFGCKSFVTDLFIKERNMESKNDKITKFLGAYEMLVSKTLQQIFKNHFIKNDNITWDTLNKKAYLLNLLAGIDFGYNELLKQKIINSILYTTVSLVELEELGLIITHLIHSQSDEIINFADTILDEAFSSDKKADLLNRYDELFLHNDAPTLALQYVTFRLLHPDLYQDIASEDDISPTLKRLSKRNQEITIFSDMARAFAGSNNLSLKNFLNRLEKGNTLYMNISNLHLPSLTDEEKKLLESFCKILILAYNNSVKGKKDNKFTYSGNALEDIEKLKHLLAPYKDIDYDIADRIIRMYFHFAGFDTVLELKQYMTIKIEEATQKNIETSLKPFDIVEGDLIKGLRKIDYLPYVMQNGILADDFIGANAQGDTTPLDADVFKTPFDCYDFEFLINYLQANIYGNLFAVFKNDHRFFTPKKTSDKTAPKGLFELYDCNPSNEVHYGIRTGIASSEIDFLVSYEGTVDSRTGALVGDGSFDSRIGLEIAINGFYIPVYNVYGELVFSYEAFLDLRKKMQGIKTYTDEPFIPSLQLDFENIEEIMATLDHKDAKNKNVTKAIYNVISSILANYGITTLPYLSSDLTNGIAEFISTGSTNRNTNLEDKTDYDFVLRLDKGIMERFNINLELLEAFDRSNIHYDITSEGHLRLKDVPFHREKINIDISFVNRNKELFLPSGQVIDEQLASIRETSFENYQKVLANILMAKRVLADAGAYHGKKTVDHPQGGLGGIGIEAWILQHNGSFYEAAVDFLDVYQKYPDFDEFIKHYAIWDFGQNILNLHRGSYIRSNYLDNMDSCGFNKMVAALEAFVIKQKNDRGTTRSLQKND